ncbi:unnamed protein product [Pedinophyceae sp. YPF-701]|nr:unnamed protein product [Pedinophyceae sp. YPF-701]
MRPFVAGQAPARCAGARLQQPVTRTVLARAGPDPTGAPARRSTSMPPEARLREQFASPASTPGATERPGSGRATRARRAPGTYNGTPPPRTTTTRTRSPGPAPRNGTTTALVRAPGQSRRPARPARGDTAVTLKRDDVAGKEVVTRRTGRKLGTVTELRIDPRSLRVRALGLKPSGVAAALDVRAPPASWVPWDAVRQVGDVVLVDSDDDVLRGWVPRPGREEVLEGRAVMTRSALTLGRVRSVEFSPDDGMVRGVLFDPLGIPAIPKEVFGVYRLPATDVLRVEAQSVIVDDDGALYQEQITQGILEALGAWWTASAGVEDPATTEFAAGLTGRAPRQLSPEQQAWVASLLDWMDASGSDLEAYERMYYGRPLPPDMRAAVEAAVAARRAPGRRAAALPPPAGGASRTRSGAGRGLRRSAGRRRRRPRGSAWAGGGSTTSWTRRSRGGRWCWTGTTAGGRRGGGRLAGGEGCGDAGSGRGM